MPLWFRKLLSATLMKNWAEAECGSMVRAMATLYFTFGRPLSASFWMLGRLSFFFFHAWLETAALDHEVADDAVEKQCFRSDRL